MSIKGDDFINYFKLLLLTNSMRLAWEQHVYWTRMLLISIAEKLPDLPGVTAQVLDR